MRVGSQDYEVDIQDILVSIYLALELSRKYLCVYLYDLILSLQAMFEEKPDSDPHFVTSDGSSDGGR